MIRFECDYAEGASEEIMQALVATNLDQTPGYGMDSHCQEARQRIRDACSAPEATVEFLVGGTQANAVMIAAALRPHQAALCAQSGHIAVHETGAIEATGHKVMTLCGVDGKLTGEQVRQAHDVHWNDPAHEHTPQPGLVYISHPTENGTTYSLAELEELSAACKDCGLLLMLDGARLGYGLAAQGADLGLADIARLCDIFSIGATKVGALFGEAVVIPNPDLAKDFRYIIKQRGGMLAKGRLLGIQFATLFRDGLYERLGAHAVEQAMRIRQAFADRGVSFRHNSYTNQQFPILNREMRDSLAQKYAFSAWETLGPDSFVVRFCTSWATRPEAVDGLLREIEKL